MTSSHAAELSKDYLYLNLPFCFFWVDLQQLFFVEILWMSSFKIYDFLAAYLHFF